MMRQWPIGSALGVILLAFAGRVGGQPPGQPAKAAGWWTDYQAARAAARQSGKPLFVVFRCQP